MSADAARAARHGADHGDRAGGDRHGARDGHRLCQRACGAARSHRVWRRSELCSPPRVPRPWRPTCCKQTIRRASRQPGVSLDQPWAQPYGPLRARGRRDARVRSDRGPAGQVQHQQSGRRRRDRSDSRWRSFSSCSRCSAWRPSGPGSWPTGSTPTISRISRRRRGQRLPGADAAVSRPRICRSPASRSCWRCPASAAIATTALAPYIAALPPGTTINICTASGSGARCDQRQDRIQHQPAGPRHRTHRQGCFPTLAVFQQSLTQVQQSRSLNGHRHPEQSYFRLRSFITIGTARFSLYSLLYLDGAGQIRPILRTFGTEYSWRNGSFCSCRAARRSAAAGCSPMSTASRCAPRVGSLAEAAH